jgi:hypothetical protein
MRLMASWLRTATLSVALAVAAVGPVWGQDDSEAYLGPHMPYQAFDRLQSTPVEVGNAVFDVAFAPGLLELPKSVVVGWIAAVRRAITAARS